MEESTREVYPLVIDNGRAKGHVVASDDEANETRTSLSRSVKPAV